MFRTWQWSFHLFVQIMALFSLATTGAAALRAGEHPLPYSLFAVIAVASRTCLLP